MNSLIKLTKATDIPEPVLVNAEKIVWAEITERKKDKMKMTVLHMDSVSDAKIFVTETPEQISEMMVSSKEIRIAL